MPIPDAHFVNGNPIKEPFAEGLEQAVFGMGCFWGVERRFWETPGVYSTAVGYAGGTLAHATYEQVILNYSRYSGKTMTPHRACARVTTGDPSTGR